MIIIAGYENDLYGKGMGGRQAPSETGQGAPRFMQCCPGTVYSVTSPTSPDDTAYPMTCAVFCQVGPSFDSNNDKNPCHFGDYFMCLNDGQIQGLGGEVACANNAVKGETAPMTHADGKLDEEELRYR